MISTFGTFAAVDRFAESYFFTQPPIKIKMWTGLADVGPVSAGGNNRNNVNFGGRGEAGAMSVQGSGSSI